MGQKHSDDMPPEQWRRFSTEEEAQANLPEESLQNPVAVGMMFCNALEDPGFYLNALRNLSTPESIGNWGDYTEAAQALKDIPDRGYSNRVNYALGDDSVCYFKIMPDVSRSFQVVDDQIVNAKYIMTLVWRDEYNQWMVHALGNYLKPEEVPH